MKANYSTNIRKVTKYGNSKPSNDSIVIQLLQLISNVVPGFAERRGWIEEGLNWPMDYFVCYQYHVITKINTTNVVTI